MRHARADGTVALMLLLAVTILLAGSWAMAGEEEPPMGLPYPPPKSPPPPEVDEETLVVIVDVPGPPPYTYTVPTPSSLSETLATVRRFYIETSYNKLGFRFDDYEGPLTVDPTPVGAPLPLGPKWGCDFYVASDYAEEVSRVLREPPHGIDLSQYDHFLLFAPFGNNCGWDGLYLNEVSFDVGGPNDGGYDVPGLDALLVNHASILYGTIAHELGHSLQVGPAVTDWVDHAFRLDCDTSFREDATTCNSGPGTEFQDTYNVMGGLNEVAFHFNAVHKDLLGWFDPGAIVEVRESGTYTIQAIEPDFGLRALKVCRAPGNEMYVEVRRAVGFDTDIEHGGVRDVVDGAMLHVRDQINPPPTGGVDPRRYASYLIDPSPEIPDDPDCDNDWCATDLTPTMKVGDTLYDATGGITLHVLASNHRAVTMEVVLDEPRPDSRPVTGLQCFLHEGKPLMFWQPGDCYDDILIERDGVQIATIPELSSAYLDFDAEAGVRSYTVTGRKAGLADTGVTCEVTVP